MTRFAAVVLTAIFLLPVTAVAQTLQGGAAPATQEAPDMILVPRGIAEGALAWIARPDPLTAVQLYATLSACIRDNPHGGVTIKMGPDQCPVVTAALAAQATANTKAAADAQGVADAKSTVEMPPDRR
jgi:hypothetical protein